MRNNICTTHLLACSFAHSIIHSTHTLSSLTHVLTHLLSLYAHLLIHFTHSFIHSRTHSFTHPLAHSLNLSLTHSFREALTEVYHRIDLDGSGAIGSTEFDFFHERTSNEPCDEDTWTVVNGWYFITLPFS